MKAVLRNCDGYYLGQGRNRFGSDVEETTDDVQQAMIFELSIEDGKVEILPSLPDGAWLLEGVTVEIRKA